MNSGQKSGYYTAILSGKKDHSLQSVTIAKQFVSSLSQWHMQVSLFASVSFRSCWNIDILDGNVKLLLTLTRKSSQTALHCTYTP